MKRDLRGTKRALPDGIVRRRYCGGFGADLHALSLSLALKQASPITPPCPATIRSRPSCSGKRVSRP